MWDRDDKQHPHALDAARAAAVQLPRAPVATISWRGSKLTQAQASVLRVGIVIRPPMFVATSLDHATAVHMADGPLVRFEIPVGCRNAYPVDDLSEFDEHEILLPPYSPLRVTGPR